LQTQRRQLNNWKKIKPIKPMKKLMTFICLFAGIQSSFSQDKYIDSLKNVLAQTKRPIDSFSAIVKIAEYNLVLKGGAQDAAVPIQLLQLARFLKNDSLLAVSYNWAGSYLAFSKGDNTGALEYYFKALPLAEKVQDKRRISSLYFDIALVYFVLQNNEEAIKNIRKGGDNLPGPSSPMYNFMLVQYQRNMSKYYLLAGQYDSALHYAQALTETSTTLRSLSFEYGALYLSGSTYAKMGDMEMADVYFKKAKEMTPLIQNSTGRLDFFEIYIRFLLSYKRINEAREQAKQLMDWGIQNNNNNLKLSAAGFMQQVFDSLHQTDSAYYYSKMKDGLGASIFSQDNINKTQALAFNDQLRIIEDNAKKAEDAQQRKENIQYALIALGIISLVMLYLLLSRSFITNSKLIEFFGVIALLIVFEFLNLLLHPFLERVTHHSPVWMLLTLVCIAALLVPLHHKVEKWATAKLVEKNKQIRLAAAKKTIEQLEKPQTHGN
jgi:tetratricopeptide (TPR) repeat protein